VAETCLRGLVLDTPDHRKVLAMTIFEHYIQAMSDLAGLFIAFSKRKQAPILKSFLEFKLDAASAGAFFDAVQSLNDEALLRALELPLPAEVPHRCNHLSRQEALSVSIALHHLVLDLRKATERGDAAALALAQLSAQSGGVVLAADARWLNGSGPDLTPDQVAVLALDAKRRALSIQGLSADETAMGRVVDAIDTATRAASNLIFAYLQTNDL
jgi:hypothetical protein